MKTRRIITLMVTAALPFTLVTPLLASGRPDRAPARAIPGSYIVTLEPGADTDDIERRGGFRAHRRFGHALHGFAARLSEAQVASLRSHPRVDAVVRDREIHALGTVPLSAGDSAPTGVRRIEAATSEATHEASGAAVAVIDSGIDLAHPDLNASAGTNCISTAAPSDDNGHGTHVAGTIGARNNGSGVTGVAPGTRVVAVKVLAADGSGSWSSVICGIDWVTSTRTDADPANDIAVANMSLGGAGQPVGTCATTTDPLHRSICRATAAGVTFVVAAGNDGWDFDYASVPDVPAAYPEVLTVSAVADSDGRAGATGGPLACDLTQADDRAASFSNFAKTSAGAAHLIAAPGSCITSTWRGGGYATISGTSMATPHVAAAAALCIEEDGVPGACSGLTPAGVIAGLRQVAAGRGPSHGFAGDPFQPISGRMYGHLAWVGIDTTAPTVVSVAPGEGATAVSTGSVVDVTFSEPMDGGSTTSAFSLVRAADGAAVAGSFGWTGGTMSFRPSTSLEPATSYTASVGAGARDAAGNPLATGRTWSFRTAEATATEPPPPPPPTEPPPTEPPPPVIVSSAPGAVTILAGSRRSGGAAQLAADDGQLYQVNSTTKGTRVADWYGRFAGVPNELRSLVVSYRGKASKSCSQTVQVYRWSTGNWITADTRTIGGTEVLVERAPAGALPDYVSGTEGDGDLRVRVRCTTGSGSFYLSGDLLQIRYEA